jgi:hypothetical protein
MPAAWDRVYVESSPWMVSQPDTSHGVRILLYLISFGLVILSLILTQSPYSFHVSTSGFAIFEGRVVGGGSWGPLSPIELPPDGLE